MRILIIICVFLIIFANGCATTSSRSSKSSQVEQLQSRVDFLESELQDKERYISDLEAELESARGGDSFSRGQKAIGETSSVPKKALTIREIQTALKNAGFYKGTVDGKKGPKTEAAIKAFQRECGLKADGIVGKRTTAELCKYL